MAVLQALNLHKRFGDIEAVAGVDLALEPGEIFGLVGPDGAGKTTTLRLLVGVVDPDRGEVTIDGIPLARHPEQARERLGYMPQQYSLYGDLTVEENLGFFADMYFVPRQERKARLDKLYRFSRLQPYASRPAAKLSGGMYKKLALSCSMIHQPKILLLDEPTTGVDPVSRRELWDILYAFAAEGVAVLVTTPYMDEAERCHRVGLMSAGRFLVADRPQAVLDAFQEALFEALVPDLGAARTALGRAERVTRTYPAGGVLKIACRPGTEAADLAKILENAGIAASSIERSSPTFEDVFLSLRSQPFLKSDPVEPAGHG